MTLAPLVILKTWISFFRFFFFLLGLVISSSGKWILWDRVAHPILHFPKWMLPLCSQYTWSFGSVVELCLETESLYIFCMSWSCHGFKSIWTDCVLDSRQSLVMSTVFCGLWLFVSLDRSILCMRCKDLHDIDVKHCFIHPKWKAFLHCLIGSDPLQVSVLTRTQPMQVSAWTLTRVSWSRRLHCHFVFHSLLTFTYECAGDQEHMHMHGFVF